MGLDDKYSDTGGAEKGWGGNIMSTRDGKPDARNILGIINANPSPGSKTQNLREVESSVDPAYSALDSASIVRNQK